MEYNTATLPSGLGFNSGPVGGGLLTGLGGAPTTPGALLGIGTFGQYGVAAASGSGAGGNYQAGDDVPLVAIVGDAAFKGSILLNAGGRIDVAQLIGGIWEIFFQLNVNLQGAATVAELTVHGYDVSNTDVVSFPVETRAYYGDGSTTPDNSISVLGGGIIDLRSGLPTSGNWPSVTQLGIGVCPVATEFTVYNSGSLFWLKKIGI